MLVAQLVATLDRLAPTALAEEWDNVGLVVGRHNQPVRRLLVALDLRDDVLGEARELRCDSILTHHPPIFPSITSLTDEPEGARLVLDAAERRVAVVAAHTNLDAAASGLNAEMAELLGLSEPRPLRPSALDPAAGLGRLGRTGPTTLERLVGRIAGAFEGAPLSYSGDPGARVELVACCTGAGGDLIADARAAGADAYVTSDLRYHDADRARGLPLVALPHARAERLALKRWTRRLERALAPEGVEVRFATTDTDPWQTA
jgi:dinuclear metal center YbgI/SA1388 family protein